MRTTAGNEQVLKAIADFCKANPSCDPMAGGCEELANALVAAIPTTEKYTVTAYDGEIVHYVTMIDGLVYDGLGAASVGDIADEWSFDRSADMVKIEKAE